MSLDFAGVVTRQSLDFSFDRVLRKKESMPTGRYLINNPTLAIFPEDGHHIAHLVPTGASIVVDGAIFGGRLLMNVTWDDKKVMMFTQDLLSHAVLAS